MPRRTTAVAADNRARVVRAAVDLASVEGLEGLTIGRLADQLKISKSGLYGLFGSKQQLQLATLQAAIDVFIAQVWAPAAQADPGRRRLQAISEAWLSYLRREVFPGGCFLVTAAAEFDARSGPVHDRIASANRDWLNTLEREFEQAAAAGELPSHLDPRQAAFELNALANGANCAFQLHRDPTVFQHAARAINRLFSP